MRTGPHSQTAMRAIALSALALAALPAGALTPPLPACIGETLAPQERARGWYDFTRQGEDFVIYFRAVGEDMQIVAEHCPSRQQMIADLPWAAYEGQPHYQTPARVEAAIRAAFAAPEVYTMRDLARIAREAGARRARVTRADYESCGCRLRHH